MVDQVVAGEGVDELAVAAQVRGGDGHELPLAGGLRELRRPRHERVAVGARSARDEEHRSVAGRTRDDRAIARRHRRRVGGSAARGACGQSIRAGADTVLTASAFLRRLGRHCRVLQISVLGPVEVRRDGRLLAVPGGRTAELLVRLALEAGVVVGADRLVEDLWADAAVHTRRNTLQQKAARLRRALEDRDVGGGDGGYRLAVAPSAVDALAVIGDAAAAAALLEGGDDHAAAELSASALGRFRGEVLPAAGDGDWARPHRARLEEARVRLKETSFAARLRLGDDAVVIGELEAAVAAHPYQEALWELLVTALYRAGRQADALAAYQRARARLADDLGLEPGPRLRDLERQVLDHERSRCDVPAPPGTCRRWRPSSWGGSRGSPSWRRCSPASGWWSSSGRAGSVRRHWRSPIGRRLSAPGGVWLARLETAATEDEVLDTVIAALRVTGGEAALHERLRGAAAVVILDNCEHVREAAAALAVRLLDAAPGLRILCTSQVPLDVDGEASPSSSRWRSPTPSSCSRAGRAAPSGPTAGLVRSCAGRSTACHLRSSSPPRGADAVGRGDHAGGSTTASPSSATPAAAGRSGAGR